MQSKTYKPLLGRSITPQWLLTGESQRLWLCDDHILVVSQTSFRERVRRFYFRDIQAITVHRTETQRRLTFVFAVLTLLFALTALLLVIGGAAGPFGVVFLVLFAAAAIVSASLLSMNLYLGPSCICRLYTAVHQERLTALGRLHWARRFIDMVTPLIESAQGGQLSEDTISQEMDTLTAARHAATTRKDGPTRVHPIRHEAGLIHLGLFSFLIIDAANTYAAVIMDSPVYMYLGQTLLFVVIVLAVAALIRQRNSDLTLGVKALTWTTVVYLFIAVYVAFFLMTFSFELGAEAEMELSDFPIYAPLMSVMGTLELVLGIAGLIMLAASQRSARTAPPDLGQ